MSSTSRSFTLPAVAASAALGLIAALLLGGLFAWRGDGGDPLLRLAVMTLVCWPALAIGAHLLVVDREATDALDAQGEQSVERWWSDRAAATAFFATMGGLAAAEGIGRALDIGWLAPVGLWHALALGLGSYAIGYARQRARG